MAYASPDTYRFLISRAKALCDDAQELLTEITSHKFMRLIWNGEIPNAINNISEMIGTLNHAVSTLTKGSKSAKKYTDMIQELKELREKLREKLRKK